MSRPLTASALWRAPDPDLWAAALAAYPRMVAARAERLPELDEWYRSDLPPAIARRQRPHVTHDELVRVAEWKMKRGVFRGRNLALVRGNDPAAVVRASTEAFAAIDAPRAALASLTALSGVGPATASAVLAAKDPARFPFFDERAAEAVPELGPVAFTTPYYLRYAEALRARATALASAAPGRGWNAELVGRALWAAG